LRKFTKIWKKNEKFIKKFNLMEDAVLKNAAGYGRVAEQATTESE
jgi:hypothetical protein